MKRKIVWKKSIKITEKFFYEIEKIFQFINAKPMYIVTNSDNTQNVYNDLDKLLQSNFDKTIVNLKIKSQNDTEQYEELEINLSANCNTIITTYKDVAQIIYYVEDENRDAILQNKLLTVFKNSTEFGWQWSKIGIIFLLMILGFIGIIVIAITVLNNNEYFETHLITGKDVMMLLLGILLGMWSALIAKKLDRIIITKYMNPIIYYIGYSKEKYDKIKQIKSNIFWTVIVGGIISLIFAIIKF